MTARDYLEQYKEACRRVRRYQQEYEDETLLIDAVRSLSDNDGMPHGSGISKPTENKAVRLADKMMRLIDAKLEAIRIRQEIFDTIMLVGGLEGEVLLERFVYFKEWMSICRELNYSWYPVRIAWHKGEAVVQDIIDGRASHTTTYNEKGLE